MIQKLFEILIFLLSLSYLVFIGSLSSSWFEERFELGSGPEITVIIHPGQSARDVAKTFFTERIVDNPSELAKWMVTLGIDRKIQPGRYDIRKGSPWEVAKQLAASKPYTFTRTIIPGSDILTLHTAFTGGEGPDLVSILSSMEPEAPSMKEIFPEDPVARLAFLLPDTYKLSSKDLKYLFSNSMALWWKKVGILLEAKGRLEESSDLAILASLVEKEAMWNDERPRIAGVIVNRLARNMPLQIDATVVYAWKLKGQELDRVLYKHLEIDSEYNTYRNKGLPPAAICVPSLESWLAAIEPEKHEYLYYVATRDGHHLFSKNYSDHKKAIKEAARGLSDDG